MSANNPDITVSDLVTQVESRIDGSDLDTTDYLPWISYAYQQVYLAITNAGKYAKEYFFGDYITFDLTNGTGEYSITTNIPRFGGIIKVEILYGGTGDLWTPAKPLGSMSNWKNFNNVSTSYRSKQDPIYYLLLSRNVIGFIPTPPSSDSGTPQAKVFYVKKPYQLTSGDDVIDIPYRFMWAIDDYVQARALEATNEAYVESGAIDAKFREKLMRITVECENEFGEDFQESIRPINTRLYSNPIGRR